jgi:predicted dehydrogenase
VSAKKELGGGVLLELSHEIDYLRWIFGEVEWIRATISQQSNLEIDVEDSAHILMGFTPQKMGEKIVAPAQHRPSFHQISKPGMVCTEIRG